MTFPLRRSRRNPGSQICTSCPCETYKERWTRSCGHGESRRFSTQRNLQPGERWLCAGGHDQIEYEKVSSAENSFAETKVTQTIVQRAKLVSSDYESEDSDQIKPGNFFDSFFRQNTMKL